MKNIANKIESDYLFFNDDEDNNQSKENIINDNNSYSPNIIQKSEQIYEDTNNNEKTENKEDTNNYLNKSINGINNILQSIPNQKVFQNQPDKNETFLSSLKKEFSSTNLENNKQTDFTLDKDIKITNDLPILQNIVSTSNLKCILNLREIALKAKNAEYNPKRFDAVIMRIREPRTTALIFTSGKMVCTGAKSEDDSKKASRQFAKIINRLGFPVKFSEFRIQNIVASCDFRFPIRLELLAQQDLRHTSYEPEMFPGLIYRMEKPKIVLLIFVSGKIVLTGAKKRDDIYMAYESIFPLISQFKKNNK